MITVGKDILKLWDFNPINIKSIFQADDAYFSLEVKMEKNRSYTTRQLYPLIFMAVLYVVTLVVSNIVVNKSILIFGYVASGSLMYPLILISSDLISEIYGYKVSRRVCWISICMTAFAALSYSFVIALPTASGNGFEGNVAINEAMKTLLGQNWKVFMFSTIAGYLSGLVNDLLFQKLKLNNFSLVNWFKKNVMKKELTEKEINKRHFGFRGFVSTFTSVIVDCVVFFIPLYLFVVGMPFTVALSNLPSVIIYQIILKAGSELILSPILSNVVVPKLNKLVEG